MAESDAGQDVWDADRLIHNELELCEAFGCTSVKDVLEIIGDNLDIEVDGFSGVEGDQVYIGGKGTFFPFTRADLQNLGEEADAFAAAPTMATALLDKLERVEGLAARVDIWAGLDANPELYIPEYRWNRRTPAHWTVAEFRAKRLAAFAVLEPEILLDTDHVAFEDMTLDEVREFVDWSDVGLPADRIEG